MKILNDVNKDREIIENTIKQFGYTPDHNFEWLKYCTENSIPSIALWEDGSVIWYYHDSIKARYNILCDPICPRSMLGDILKEFTRYVLGKGENCMFIDVRDDVKNILETIYSNQVEMDYEIIWPVVDMKSFDPSLPGGHFKDIRNALHKFNREHKMIVVPTMDVTKVELHGIIDRWFQNRAAVGIEVLPGRYHAMVDNDFLGTKSSRVMIVDGSMVGFNAGWETPSNSSEWSASIGIHDYSVKELGVALMHEDLVWIKAAGYLTSDLEGSELKSLKFKTQFFSKYETYRTYTFHIKNSSL